MSMEPIIGTPIFDVNRNTNRFIDDNIGMSIGTRIRAARKQAGLTQKQLSERVGMSQPALSELETGESVSTTNLASIAYILGVNAFWLETGKGEPKEGLPPAGVADPILPGAMNVIVVDDASQHDFYQIPKVTLRLQAGINGVRTEPDRRDGGLLSVPKSWVDRSGYSATNLIAIHVKGESMEPTLYEGDLIVINLADRELVDNGVYAINYEGEAIVKRLSRDAGDWWLVSDNPDQRKYHRKLCRGAECIVVGRVVRRESIHF